MPYFAVVGAGPSGVFTTAELLKRPGVRVDVFDRLPSPFGLARYGVAPDHPKIKSVITALTKVLDDSRVSFHGNLEYGSDFSLQDLRASYDGVVLATGTPGSNRLGVPGEDLPGSLSAGDLVSWYNAHPIDGSPWEAAGPQVAIIGAGNVALDVARVLVKASAGLATTDIPVSVAAALDAHPVTDIHLIIRRSVADVKFSPKELLELNELDLDIIMDPAAAELNNDDLERASAVRVIGQRCSIFSQWAQRPPQGAPKRLHFHFRQSPVEIMGDGAVNGIRLRSTDDIASWVLPVSSVIAAVGFRTVPLPGVPFDPTGREALHSAGRIEPGVYVSGWLKRGPSGMIGSNKQCATETVHTLFTDLDDGVLPAPSTEGALVHRFAARGNAVVDWAGWQRIDEAERTLGANSGRGRVKIAERARLLQIGTCAWRTSLV